MTMEGYYERVHLLYAILDHAHAMGDRSLAARLSTRIQNLRTAAPFPRPQPEP